MFKDVYPVQWTGERAVVTLPEHIDVSNADQVREELLMLINRGAVTLIAERAGPLVAGDIVIALGEPGREHLLHQLLTGGATD